MTKNRALVGSSDSRKPFARYSSIRQRIRGALSRRSPLTPNDSAERISEAILADRYLSIAYGEMYSRLSSLIPRNVQGRIVEIGAGSGIGKRWIPEMTCTDVVPATTLDEIVDAAHLPYPDESIRAFVLKDALHHLPDVEAFLVEAQRCLKPGGAIVLCEPYWGALAKFVYKYFHPEPFDESQQSWLFQSSDAWDSNQAMAWMVLRRDRQRLQQIVPSLELEEFGALLGPSYLMSGGVFGRLPVPSRFLLWIHEREQRLGKTGDVFRLEYAFRLTKKS